MPLDAVCLQAVVAELSPLVAGSRIEKIQQPARDQVVLLLRGSRRLGYGQPYGRGDLSVLVIYAVHQFFNAQRVHVAKAVVALFGYVCHGVVPFGLFPYFSILGTGSSSLCFTITHSATGSVNRLTRLTRFSRCSSGSICR